MTVLLILVLLLSASLVDAATLYVNNSGSPTCSDATSKASNSSGSPWCTILRATNGSTTRTSPNAGEAASAGDTVLITAGVYTETGLTIAQGAGRFTVALNPANSGTAGNPITFRGVGSAKAEVRSTLNTRGPTIGCDTRNYITWDNFKINDYYLGSLRDTGPVSFWDGRDCQIINSEVIGVLGEPYYHGYQYSQDGTISSSGTSITGSGTTFTYFCLPGRTIVASGQTLTIATCTSNSALTVTSTPSPALSGASFTASSFGGNYRLISCEKHDNVLVKNNRIHGSSNSAGGYLTYDCDGGVVEHNEIYDTSLGIYFKGLHYEQGLTQANNIARYNLIHDVTDTGLYVEVAWDTTVYQNIVYDTTKCMHAGAFGPVRAYFINNSCYNMRRGNQVNEEVFGWAASTLYPVDFRVKNGTNLYQCITAGTSAGSGGPTGTGADITDGTVHWAYVSAAAGSNNHSFVDVEWQNNIYHTIAANGSAWYDFAHTDPTGQDFISVRNVYYANSGEHASYNGQNFATWQGFSQDTNSTNGTDPQFVNAAAYNFHLQSSGQDALTRGRVVHSIGGVDGTTIPVGAYITGSETIGIEGVAGSGAANAVGAVRFTGSVRIQ